ncbi:VRR-NUC domain-containing protein [Lacticaseibacillus rhamnosus]
MKSEHEIQSEIMLALSRAGCTIIRTNVGKVRTETGRIFVAGPPKGWPDLTGFRHHDGRLILIEVKNETGRLRQDQKHFAEFIKQFPVIYGVARSAEDALKLIEI